jgi:sugar (pentulose or hexulose) kinase
VDWLLKQLGDPPVDYSQLEALLEKAPAGPTGILYFPYLSGSASPHTNLTVRGAFVGLDATHDRSHLAKAVLEGTAFEVEVIRRAGAPLSALEESASSGRVVAAGGGVRSPYRMQIKADVFGCPIDAWRMPETSLLGAALLAAAGCGVYSSQEQALDQLNRPQSQTYLPDPARHAEYRRLYEDGFLAFQKPLRSWNPA